MSAQLKDKDLHAFFHGFSSLSQIREHGPRVMVRGKGFMFSMPMAPLPGTQLGSLECRSRIQR
ncbi:MAG: hypothetical protein CM1200mP20_00050 [Pseudomonadota bacterium]|nr:MAG: hypothetical protein CM1200mP20_00050 [Pseudomonadota bacterium]